MDIASSLVDPLVVLIKKPLDYLISYTKYVRDLGDKMHQLEFKKVEVENHMNHNKSNNLEVPTEVRRWLEEVLKINAQVESILSTDVVSCFSLKQRYMLGKKAFKIIEEINYVIHENNMIKWTDYPIPLGKVDSMNPSTSTPSTHHDDFKSREWIFMEAVRQLQPDHKSQMIALCGMGGVGKTTMMKKLKEFVAEEKIFDFIVEAVIGANTDPISIQQCVADFLGVDLRESTKAARAIKLQKSFKDKSDGGRNKFLVILDDVWQLVDLNDIGLSPLPNQGVGFKVLLTSRSQKVCFMMGVEVNSILNLDVIQDSEAQSFFHQLVKTSDAIDPYLTQIGDDIVSRCHGLPLAIKIVASILKGQTSKHVWEDTLSWLKNNRTNQLLHQVFEASYNNLQNEETKSVFLLCGLFHEDISREDLVRCGWGLKLFHNVYNIREARNRLNKCVDELILENLLIESQDVGCVKMHNLVQGFVLEICSKGKHASVVGKMSKLYAKETSVSCTRLSITCKGMREFPRDYKYPNLLLMKLMHGDKSLQFPEDFCKEMKKLEVIAFDIMECGSLSKSLQCSSNLRTLCLHRCSLMNFDCSSIGDIMSLEVLSFAHCSIRKLPSTIGNLKELKLLDLTGCVDLCIDDGVLRNLVNLEELYMRVADNKSIRFTYSNRYEFAECLKNLFALEIEFFGNNSQPKNMSFKKLERFKISLGCYLRENNGQNMNTLMLVTDKRELVDSRLYELFEKTEVLNLQVNDINDLGDVLADGVNDLGVILVESIHQYRPQFYFLRVLEVCECANLRYLFTVDVANGLMKLERLTVSFCPVLETLVDGGNGGVSVIKFQALKFLSLGELPKLMSLCNIVNLIELPQLEELILYSLPNFTSIYPDNESSTSSMQNGFSAMQPFLNKEVVIPELKILKIFYMKNLKEIWPSEPSDGGVVGLPRLRAITVEGCDNLVNLFPMNPTALLHHLEEVKVWNCGSIDVLFNFDVGCVGEIMEGNHNLRYIEVIGLGKLRDIWRVKGVSVIESNLLVRGFHAVEHIEIRRCKVLSK